MALEAWAAVGATASIATLLKAGIGTVNRINDFRCRTNDVPQCFRQIDTVLPVLSARFDQILKDSDVGSVAKRRAIDKLLPIIKECVEQVGKLENILSKAVPEENDRGRERTKKALKSVWYEKEVQNITNALDGYVKSLTYHTVSESLQHDLGIYFAKFSSVF